MDNTNYNIINPSDSFNFTNLTLAKPTGGQGGTYFTKILCNKNPLYIQSTSLTKNGFIKSGKKYCSDLMFDNNSEELINWFEKLETRCHELVFEKSKEWFNGDLDLTDIESAFNPIIKVYKSGKWYLIRAVVQNNALTNLPNIKIYDEYERELAMDDVVTNTTIISILEIQGIKFTNKCFQFEIALIQVMVLKNYSMFENCLIKHKKPTPLYIDEPDLEQLQNEKIIQDEISSSINNDINDTPLDENVFVEPENNVVDTDKHINNDNNETDEISTLTKLINEYNSNTIDLDLEIENLDTIPYNENNKDLKEIELGFTLDNNLKPITLKKPNEVYYKIYRDAMNKAKQAKKEADMAYLEAQSIKEKYMLNDLDESDNEIDDENVDF
jgi:hypothetical protein